MKRITDPDALLLQGAADPTRLSILRQLAGAAGITSATAIAAATGGSTASAMTGAAGEICACDFDACCEVAQPTVSHHLKVLREAGWVTSERRGSWVYYRLRPDAVARFRGLAGELGGSVPDGERPAGRRLVLPVIQPEA